MSYIIHVPRTDANYAIDIARTRPRTREKAFPEQFVLLYHQDYTFILCRDMRSRGPEPL